MTSTTSDPQNARPFLLDGAWHSAGSLVEVRSPFDGQLVAQVHQGTRAHADAAIAAAVRAFEITRKLGGYERQRVLHEVSAALAKRKEEFALVMAREAGKPLKAARVEVERAAFTFQVAAEEATRLGGEYLPLDWQASTAGRWAIVRRFALGPIGGITPFNFPLNLVAHKLAPAMAAGCSFVLKPAPQTPLSALLLAEVIEQAGWPAGGLNVLPLSNEDAGLLVTDERLKMISFTGSAKVGWQIKSQAGKKKVVLELGGNAGVIVHGDADLACAAERCVAGGFSYAGQTCIAVQRILVERPVYDKFVELLLARVAKLKSGNPLDETVDVGPLIRESDAIRAEQWVREAVAAGARLLCGGKRSGSMLEPTVLTDTTAQMKVNCEEVFAPIVTIEAYADFAQAIAMVNQSSYGLQAGLFTRDANRIFRAFEEIEVGGLMIGEVPTFRIDHMPYGGVKDSGQGREGIRYAMEEMTEPRLLAMNLR